MLGSSLLIFYNKSDIEGAMTLEEVKDFLEMDKIKNWFWAILPSSGVTGKGLL